LHVGLAQWGRWPPRDPGAGAAPADGCAAHVLLLSIDGFHQLDLDRWVTSHPASTLASLVARGTRYTKVTSSRPSDSFPGTLAMTTGGSPASTGVFYDVSWDDTLSPPGSACSTLGAVVPFDGAIDVDDNAVTTSVDPAKLPLDPARGCALQANAAALGIGTLYSGDALLRAFGGTLDADRSPRPDIIIQPAPGVIYTTTGVATKKTEHGGFSDENTQVPLVLAGPGVSAGVIEQPVDLRLSTQRA
jgi:type I phosphodiesterase/nucleotide pyrophosphatase